MACEWLRIKEENEVRAKNISICEARATEKLIEERRLKVISKGEECDYQRIMQAAREEVEQEQNLAREKKKTEQACLDLQWTQKLAEEVSRLKHEEIKQEKQRQLLRLTSVELRELEKQLRTAYNAKSLEIQLKERVAIRANTRCQELQEDKAIKGWYQNDHSEKDNLVRDYEKRERYRKDLQDQLIINCERRKKQKSEEEQRDRKMREEITQLLREEKAEKTRQKEEMIVRSKVEEEAFHRAKEIWECKQKEAILDEYNRNERIIMEKENQMRLTNDLKIEKLAARERIMDKMAGEILKEKVKRIEREDIINTFHEEEAKISMQAKLRKQSLEKQRLAKDLLEDMLRQKKALDERKTHETAVDNDFARHVAEQNQIAIKQEQDKIRARRLQGLRYGEYLKDEIQNKNVMKIEEKRRKEESIYNDKKAENIRKQEIFEEYSRILQLNAPQLEGFIKLKDMSVENFENFSKQMY